MKIEISLLFAYIVLSFYPETNENMPYNKPSHIVWTTSHIHQFLFAKIQFPKPTQYDPYLCSHRSFSLLCIY